MILRTGVTAACAAAAVVALPAASLAATTGPAHYSPHARTAYRQVNLISDIPGVARITDPNLVNPWGEAAAPGGPLWVADAGSNDSTVYTGATHGAPLKSTGLVVSIPAATPPTPTGATGIVFNPGTGFVVSDGTHSAPAKFIFDTISGDIDAWAPSVGTASGTSTKAEAVVKEPATAAFTGLAVSGGMLFAANARQPQLEVFDSAFKPVALTKTQFTDPNLPAGANAFNVAVIGGNVYVSYAGGDDPAPHDGTVDVYSQSGTLLRRLVSGGVLNLPWAMVIAPAHFGTFSRDLLVGNFGDGTIHAFSPRTGKLLGTLRNHDGNVITIQRLWDLIPGNGVAGTPSELLFSAGIGDEQHGLLGTISG